MSHSPPAFAVLLTAEYERAALPPRPRERGECESPDRRICSICHASLAAYEDELAVKDRALRAFQRLALPGVTLLPLVPSPLGRGYRGVSKRKAFASGRGVQLGLIQSDERGRVSAMPVGRCAVEPAAHAAVYALLREKLAKPYTAPLRSALMHAIVKGGEQDLAVILSVGELEPRVVHAANTLSKSLTRELPVVTSVSLYLDETSGSHYLGVTGADARPVLRRLHGSGERSERIGERTFRFPPLSFSQVNPATASALVTAVGAFLPLDGGARLYDLYCGYGLFALSLAQRAGAVIGADLSHASVDAARANARRMRIANARFLRSDIDADAVQRIMARSQPGDAVILDPPRNGTPPGVIESIASRAPARVAHLVCRIDLLPQELARWTACGYRARSITPFDMFPGTDEVEMLAVMEREPEKA
jgi:tRNA/tmRNA/rRNA uracil-C5-methylase (TrmA/RlmC/RlmD family)